MNTRILKVARELQRTYGRAAVVNLICILRGEIDRFVGLDGPAITTYCKSRGVL